MARKKRKPIVRALGTSELIDQLLIRGNGKRANVAPTDYAEGGTEIFAQEIPAGKKALIYELVIVPNANAQMSWISNILNGLITATSAHTKDTRSNPS